MLTFKQRKVCWLRFPIWMVLILIEYTCIHARKLSNWRGPSSFILGDFPPERSQHGMVEAAGNLYIFAGASRSSGKIYTHFIPLSMVEFFEASMCWFCASTYCTAINWQFVFSLDFKVHLVHSTEKI